MDEASRKKRRRSIRNLRRSSSNFTPLLEPFAMEEKRGADVSNMIQNYGSAWIGDENIDPVKDTKSANPILQQNLTSAEKCNSEHDTTVLKNCNIRLNQESLVPNISSTELFEKRCLTENSLASDADQLNETYEGPYTKSSLPPAATVDEHSGMANSSTESLPQMDLDQCGSVDEWLGQHNQEPSNFSDRGEFDFEGKNTFISNYLDDSQTSSPSKAFEKPSFAQLSPETEAKLGSKPPDLYISDAEIKLSPQKDFSHLRCSSSGSEIGYVTNETSQYKVSTIDHVLEDPRNSAIDSYESNKTTDKTSLVLGMTLNSAIESLALRLEALSSISASHKSSSDTSGEISSKNKVATLAGKQYDILPNNSHSNIDTKIPPSPYLRETHVDSSCGEIFSNLPPTSGTESAETSSATNINSTASAAVSKNKRRLSLKKASRPSLDNEPNTAHVISSETVVNFPVAMNEPPALDYEMKYEDTTAIVSVESSMDVASQEVKVKTTIDTEKIADLTFTFDSEAAALAEELSLRFPNNDQSVRPKSRDRHSDRVARRRSSRLFFPAEFSQLNPCNSDANLCDQGTYQPKDENALQNLKEGSSSDINDRLSSGVDHESLGQKKRRRKAKITEDLSEYPANNLDICDNPMNKSPLSISSVKDSNSIVANHVGLPEDANMASYDIQDNDVSNDCKTFLLPENDMADQAIQNKRPCESTSGLQVATTLDNVCSNQAEARLTAESCESSSGVEGCMVQKNKRSQRTCKRKSWVLPATAESSSLPKERGRRGASKNDRAKQSKDTSKVQQQQNMMVDISDEFEISEELRLLYLNKKYQPPPTKRLWETIRENPPNKLNVFSTKRQARLLTFEEGLSQSRMLKRYRKATQLRNLSQINPVPLTQEEFKLKMASLEKMLEDCVSENT
ncbi:hypothetical protein PoB_003708700 [Plakobranchus ocellatus]|uniref:Tantalus-like domain-containing protein n=1 Tax=Plakobranchus ocellatus TaxID=259542 RepID=A0AAV4ATE2_9GAST|nr:hypothetical protein PoB_003708700 [Plakobranchus ocellatus]